jgi:SAM-dependent methyltransferase
MRDISQLFPPEFFARTDENDDRLFYAEPHFIDLIDVEGQAALTQLLSELLPEHGTVLDLMASHNSHVPLDLPCTLYGLGLNAEEMATNLFLTDLTQHDLNSDPTLPFPDAMFDAVLCTASAEYLLHPVELFADVNRVLRPNGVFVVTFSDRVITQKVVQGWMELDEAKRVALIAAYFQLSGGWGQPATRVKALPETDPVFMVWAFKGETGTG